MNGTAIVGPIRQPSDILQRALPFQVLDQLEKSLLPLAPDHIVAEVESLIRQKSHMRSAHDRRDPRFFHVLCIAIGVHRGGSDGRDADQVGGENAVPVHLRQALREDAYFVTALFEERAEEGKAKPGKLHEAVDVQARRDRFDEGDAHLHSHKVRI